MSDFECEYEDDGYDYAYDSDGGGGAMDTEDGQQGGEAAAVDPAIEMENAFYEGVSSNNACLTRPMLYIYLLLTTVAMFLPFSAGRRPGR